MSEELLTKDMIEVDVDWEKSGVSTAEPLIDTYSLLR